MACRRATEGLRTENVEVLGALALLRSPRVLSQQSFCLLSIILLFLLKIFNSFIYFYVILIVFVLLLV